LHRVCESPPRSAFAQGEYRLPVLALLALNLDDFSRNKAGFRFQQPKRRARFDAAMLALITGEHDAAIERVSQVEDAFHGMLPSILDRAFKGAL
jgi:hypothetical protein